jgi:hypothetical protein
MLLSNLLMLDNLTYYNATTLMLNESNFNGSINSSISELNQYDSHIAMGECNPNSPGDTFMEINTETYPYERRCASHKAFLTGGLFSHPFILYLSQSNVNPFGLTDAPSSCVPNKICEHDRLYANIDDCKAYAQSSGQSYWLYRNDGYSLPINGEIVRRRFTMCGICIPGGELILFNEQNKESNVCPPTSSPPPSPPPDEEEGGDGNSTWVIIGATIGGVVGLGLLVAAVAWLTGAVRVSKLWGDSTGAKPTTFTLKRFPATFEINSNRVQTVTWS